MTPNLNGANAATHQVKQATRGRRRPDVQTCSRLDQPTSAAAALHAPFWKRCLDVSLIVLTAPAWLPLMISLGAMIKLISPGPALFTQERIGLGGRRFVCFKFRTMHTGSATNVHEKYLADLMKSNRPMTKLDGQDPRLIPMAWIVRSTGLDELPQLFNVLRGEMSLVGPRPCTPQEYAAYSTTQKSRLKTMPGLTGLWQVNGKNRTTFDEMIELDLRYLGTLCLWLDIGIMLRTPVAIAEQVAESILRRKQTDHLSGTLSRPQTGMDGARPTGVDLNKSDGRTSVAEVLLPDARPSCLAGNPSQTQRTDTLAIEREQDRRVNVIASVAPLRRNGSQQSQLTVLNHGKPRYTEPR